jgi:hypothetical protein
MEKNKTFEELERTKQIQAMIKLVPNEMTPICLEDLQEMFAQ